MPKPVQTLIGADNVGTFDAGDADIRFAKRSGGNYIRGMGTKSEHDRIVAEFKSSTDGNVVNFVQIFRDEDIKNPNAKNHKISDVSERESADIKNLLGIDVADYTHNLNGSSVQHIERRHGVNGKADQSMADINNYGRIGYVLKNYDNMEVVHTSGGDVKRTYGFRDANKKPSPMIVYTKRVNGNFYVVEAVPETRTKRLQIVSTYLNDAETGSGQAPHAQGLGHNVRNAVAHAPDTTTE